MPKVPTYDQPQVAQQGFSAAQNIALPDAAFGITAGRSIAVAGNQMADVAFRIKKEDDDAAVKAGVLELRSAISAMSESENGYYNQQGENALYDARDNYLAEVNKLREKIGKRMQPGRQAQYFSELSGEYVFREEDASARHAAAQRKVYQSGLYKAERQQATEDAARFWNENQPYLDQIKRSINNNAKTEGWSDERKEFEMEAALTGAHSAAVKAILSQDNPAAAVDYLAKNADEISGTQLNELQDMVRDHGTLKEAMEVSDLFRGSKLSIEEKLSQVAKMDLTPEVREKAEARIKSDQSVMDAADDKRRGEIFTSMYQELLDNPDYTYQDLQRMRPDEWGELGVTEIKALQTGVDPYRKTDRYASLEIKALIARQDYTGAMQFLTSNMDKFSDEHFHSYLAAIEKPIKPDQSESDNSAFDRLMTGIIGDRPTGKGAKSLWDQKNNIMYGYYSERLAEWRKNNPNYAAIPEDERNKILDEIRLEYTKPAGGVFNFLPDFMTPDVDGDFGDLSDEEIDSLRKELTDNGLNDSPAQVFKLYKLKVDNGEPIGGS